MRGGLEARGAGYSDCRRVRFPTPDHHSYLALVLVGGVALATAAPAHKLVGHYRGHNQGGRSVSFDVAGAKPKIKNFSIAVDVECWNGDDNDGQSDRLLAQITGFHGKVKKDGSFDIYYAPDDDTEFQFSGVLKRARRRSMRSWTACSTPSGARIPLARTSATAGAPSTAPSKAEHPGRRPSTDEGHPPSVQGLRGSSSYYRSATKKRA